MFCVSHRFLSTVLFVLLVQALFLLTVSRESKLSDLINFRGLGIGHLSKTEGSQRELAKSIASCSKKAVPKERLVGNFGVSP